MFAETLRGECVDPHRALTSPDLEAMCVAPAEELRIHREAIASLEQEALKQQLRAAAELFGEDYLGPKQFEATFGFMPENIPDLPAWEFLERGKALGLMLVLHVEKKPDGKLMSITAMNDSLAEKKDEKLVYNTHWDQNEAFYTPLPRLGWRLVAKVPFSKDKNAIQQLEQIVVWLKEMVFKGLRMPENYAAAIIEFEQQKADITRLMNMNLDDDQWSEASLKIAALSLAQLTLPTPAELIQTIAVHHQASGEYLLPNCYVRTAMPDLCGGLVRVGEADANGAGIGKSHPGDSYSYLCVLPSLQC